MFLHVSCLINHFTALYFYFALIFGGPKARHYQTKLSVIKNPKVMKGFSYFTEKIRTSDFSCTGTS